MEDLEPLTPDEEAVFEEMAIDDTFWDALDTSPEALKDWVELTAERCTISPKRVDVAIRSLHEKGYFAPFEEEKFRNQLKKALKDPEIIDEIREILKTEGLANESMTT